MIAVRSSIGTASFSARVKRTVSGACLLQILGLDAQINRLKGAEAVVHHQDAVNPLDLFGGIKPVGLGDAHQQGGKCQAGIRLGEPFGGGGQQATEEIGEHAARLGGRKGAAKRKARK